MNPRYSAGQKVVIKPPAFRPPEPRDATLDIYAGQTGTIVNYYWISPRFSEVFYIYRVKVESNGKEITVHEDEIEERTDCPLKGKK
jgi:hypothetical protein